MTDLGLPGPEEIDAAWLTAALAATGALPVEASVVAVTSTPIGTGQMGSSVRFGLTWDVDDPGLPATVVGKFPSHDERSRAAGAAGAYERELGFYRDLQPHAGVATPRPYYAAYDPATAGFTLLMSDVDPAHQGDQLAGCSLADAALAVETIASLHAATWDRVAALSSAYAWLPAPTPERFAEVVTRYRTLYDGFARDFADRLSPQELALGQWIGERFVDLALAHRLPRCVTHNDYRLDNLLFGDAPEVAPLTVVDWQTMGFGVGPVDVAYFVGTGLVEEPSPEEERELVTRYWRRLVELGAGGGEPPTFDDVWHSYRLGATSGYVMAVIASQLVVRTERGDDMFTLMARRPAQQMARLGVVELLG